MKRKDFCLQLAHDILLEKVKNMPNGTFGTPQEIRAVVALTIDAAYQLEKAYYKEYQEHIFEK